MMSWVFRILAAVSLPLWLAIVVAWPMSYWWRVSYVLHPRPEPTTLSLSSGRIWWSRGGLGASTDPGLQIERDSSLTGKSMFSVNFDQNDFHLLGFEYEKSIETITVGGMRTVSIPILSRSAALPIWLPFILFAWPIIPWISSRRRAAMPGHHCRQCGYDLRATPDRCPECGIVQTRE